MRVGLHNYKFASHFIAFFYILCEPHFVAIWAWIFVIFIAMTDWQVHIDERDRLRYWGQIEIGEYVPLSHAIYYILRLNFMYYNNWCQNLWPVISRVSQNMCKKIYSPNLEELAREWIDE